ncbi:hypothetical protein LUZ60_014773 [Juncus effusus]|nr:hypothetical protein LUZ60_014773 [Juncus effusus]
MGLGDDAASASLQVLFQIVANQLINLVKEEIRLEYGLHKELEEMEKDVKMIGAVLKDNDDAELSESLKIWLGELREVAYDAIDVLDDHYTERLRRYLKSFPDTRNFFSLVNPKRLSYRHKIAPKMKDVVTRMDRISKRRQNFGLFIRPSNSSEGESSNSRIESTSSLPPILTVGRETDKQRVVRELTSQNIDEGADSIVSVLAVHGVCGIGKTMLAQMVYNDITISTQFELKLWVNMSHREFNPERLTRSIIESVDQGLPFGGTSLHSLQIELEKRIKGRRYLLVLDDYWHENRHDWEKLKIPLYKGAVGSRILITTRSRLVVDTVDTLGSYHLRGLSEDECFSLVCQYASSRYNDLSNDLYEVSSDILNKCRGIPMEAISLGNRLHRENDREKWRNIIQTEDDIEFSDERNNFMRAMRLTYSRLPLNLKPCFSYCSIIPEGARLDKEWLIQLWMAQGFIPFRDGRQAEDIGNDYFDSLVRRSFLQKAWANINGDRHEYHISDVIHDVSRSISNEECCIFELDKQHNLNPKVLKHMSFIITNVSPSNVVPFQKIYSYKGLYTLLVTDHSFSNHLIKVPEDLADKLASLRTLDFSYCNVTSLPDSIGDLKHLRCLQLWSTKIKSLPNSVCHLYNLQTLGLRNCNLLERLPNEIKYLQKLRHLDLHLDDDLLRMAYNTLKSMPPKTGRLVELRILSRFVISENEHCGISELGNLDKLQGELLISNMDLIKNPRDAMEANLENKKQIKKLRFIWTSNPMKKWHTNNTWIEENILENLKPNSSIKLLDIIGYGGVRFPSWLGSGYLYNLQTLCLSDWKKCINLPPLGYLPLLRDLYIKGMDSVQSVDCKFCGSTKTSFRCLKKLTFESMSNLENWHGHENCQLSCLDELVLRGCRNLQSINHNLPNLTKLTIEGSPRFNGQLWYPSLKYLEIDSSGDWIWASLPLLSSLVSLTLSQLSSEILPSHIPKELNSLRSLEISHCYNLLEMPGECIPNGLTHLSIKHCPKLQRLPRGIQNLRKLEDIEIEDCIRLEYLPELKSLKSLTRLEISGCHSILFLPSEGFPRALNFLSISDCPWFTEQFEDVRSLDRPKIANIFSVWIDGKNMSSSIRHQGENSRS